MSFLEPLLLAGLPLVALPIIIHLLNRRRYRTVAWGAMMFLLQAARRSRKQSRLRHLLILAARMLAIAALVFVIARPLASGWLGLLGGMPDTVIVILDRSASMEQRDMQSGRSKRSTAVDQIIDTLQKAGTPRNLVLVDSGTGIAQRLESIDDLRATPAVLGTDAAADIPALLQTALEYMVANQAGRTDIWICSDLQREDWNEEAGQWQAIRQGFADQSRNVRFQLLAYRREDDDNLSVRINRVERVQSDDTDLLALDIVVQGNPESPSRKVPIEVVIDGARTVSEVTLERGRAMLKGYEIALEGNRTSGWGKLQLPNDPNQRDNVFYFAYGPRVSWRTVVVADQPELIRPVALAAAPKILGQPLEATTIAPDVFSSVELDQVAMVVWQAALPAGSAAMRLQHFVDQGGVCLFLPARDGGDASVWNTRFGRWQQVGDGTALRVDQWRDDSGLLSNDNSGRALPVGELEIHAYCPIEGEGQALARMSNGEPFLARVPTDRGAVYFLSTVPTMPDSNMAQQGIVLFAIVQRALAAGADRLSTSRLATVGQQGLGNASDWHRLSDEESDAITRQNELASGVYQVGDTLLATNRPADQDRPRPLADDQLEELFAGLEYRIVNDDVRSKSPLIREIWKLFAVFVLMALLLEAALCLPDVQARSRQALATGT